MSGFCVFGVAMQDCIKRARKSVKEYIEQDGKRIWLTDDEWRTKVDEESRRLFTIARAKQISPAMDSPHFCEDWISVGEKTAQIRSPKIMVRGEKKDKKGGVIVKKGNPVIGWIPYGAAPSGSAQA